MTADQLLIVVKMLASELRQAAIDAVKTIPEQKDIAAAIKGLEAKAIVGPKGDKGDKGDKGERGADGRDGKDGKDGKPGRDGVQGRDGAMGAAGPAGPKGDKGDKGDPGKIGFAWRGEYKQGHEYKYGDVVSYAGALWIAIKKIVLSRPADGGASWDLLLRPQPGRIAGYGVVQAQGSGSGSSITLKTNGTSNGSQSILNLKNGSNVTVTDDGVGGITIASTGGFADPTTTKGDLITRTSSAVTRLAIGANNYVLTADSTQAEGMKWAAAGAGSENAANNVLRAERFY